MTSIVQSAFLIAARFIPGYSDRRRNNDHDSTAYETQEGNGTPKAAASPSTHLAISEGQEQYHEQYPSQRGNHNNNRYGGSRGRRGGNYRYSNNIANEYYEEDYGIGGQASGKFSHQKTSNNGTETNNGGPAETTNGGPKDQRTPKQQQQQSNGVI